jgi:hypothetical protein
MHRKSIRLPLPRLRGHAGPKVTIVHDPTTRLFLARHRLCGKQVAAAASWNDAMLTAARHVRRCKAELAAKVVAG